jgi:putative restriction endonuclease
VFFPPEAWVPQPRDWPIRTQTDKRYDLSSGIGLELWERCLAAARALETVPDWERTRRVAEVGPRYGNPLIVTPRLGQGTFRIGVMDAYERACAITQEHSLPALEAAHIRPYDQGGPHAISNGVLLRADLHRLFDKGYLTITPELRLEVSGRLRAEYQNGRTYYPLHGKELKKPARRTDRPDPEFLRYHNEHVFAA